MAPFYPVQFETGLQQPFDQLRRAEIRHDLSEPGILKGCRWELATRPLQVTLCRAQLPPEHFFCILQGFSKSNASLKCRSQHRKATLGFFSKQNFVVQYSHNELFNKLNQHGRTSGRRDKPARSGDRKLSYTKFARLNAHRKCTHTARHLTPSIAPSPQTRDRLFRR